MRQYEPRCVLYLAVMFRYKNETSIQAHTHTHTHTHHLSPVYVQPIIPVIYNPYHMPS